MKNTKLISLLRTFSKDEVKDFRRYVALLFSTGREYVLKQKILIQTFQAISKKNFFELKIEYN